MTCGHTAVLTALRSGQPRACVPWSGGLETLPHSATSSVTREPWLGEGGWEGPSAREGSAVLPGQVHFVSVQTAVANPETLESSVFFLFYFYFLKSKTKRGRGQSLEGV